MSRKATHPGRILRNGYIKPLDLKISHLASSLNIHRSTLSSFVNEKRDCTLNLAFRLSKHFKTTPNFWMNLQMSYDIWCAGKNKELKSELKNVKRIGRRLSEK